MTRLDEYRARDFSSTQWHNGQQFRALIGADDFHNLIVAALEQGLSTYFLASLLGVSQSTFYRAVTDAGITFHPLPRR